MDPNPKQLAVERIKDATNILVTVSKNPTVDQLSACIGFTLLLNKLGKHATAVFSGTVPSTLEFLQPEKTIEQTTDSLRDFIIALDKSKADKLRYKVEDEVVRIFITPYRTSITDKDLDFSQGDFNVDVVVALGVTNKEDIDQAIVTHGRILHDATVISVTNGEPTSDVGSILWHDTTASSLSEMLVSVSESFQSGLLDGQMATAFLTGIVAETDRFSNDKTSPKVMTMSAQLMAAGANQQLIATQLTPPAPEPVPEPQHIQPEEPVAVYQPPTDEAKEEAKEEEKPSEEESKSSSDGVIEILHDVPVLEEPVDEDEIHIDDQGNLKRQEELRLAEEAAKKKHEEEERKRLEEENKAQDPDKDAIAPAPESYIAGEGHKVIQPLNNTPHDPLAAFAPPVPAVSPMGEEPGIQLPPILPDSTYQPTPTTETVVPDPAAVMPEPTPVAAMPQPAEEHHIEQPVPSWSLPKPGPEPQSDTLASLEQAVGSPHVADLDSARQAVATAGLDSVPRPAASASVGAQFMDIATPAVPATPGLIQPQTPNAMPGIADVLQQTSNTTPDPMSPPPVPPPMMPHTITPQGGHTYLGNSGPTAGQTTDQM